MTVVFIRIHLGGSSLHHVLLLQDLVTCEQAGRDLAVQVKRRLKNKEKSTAATSAAEASQASGRKKAMGRVVGSLSVVTAADEDLKTGMLASWISQVGALMCGLAGGLMRYCLHRRQTWVH